MAIVFINDWQAHPDAIIHRTTTNKSFLILAEKYKRMGVRNYHFILALLQPALEGVNPHDPNLSEEIQSMIALECLKNPWYFLREVCRVPPQGGVHPLMFKANRGNIALWWSFFAGVDPFLVQPRQTGKSVAVDMLISYLLYIAANNSRINLLTQRNDLRVSNVERLKEIRDYLPDYLQLRHRDDANNTIEVDCTFRKNTLSTAVAQASKSGAYSIGRGLTAPLAVIDEFPYCENIETTLSVMLMSGIAARDEAKLYGMPFGTIFTTTAGPRNTPSGRYAYGIYSDGFEWDERIVFDMGSSLELRALMNASTRQSAKLVMNITMSHTQLGYSDEWMMDKIRETAAKGENADRDLFNKWTDGDTAAPLSGDLLERISASEREPEYIEMHPNNYMLKWYIPQSEIASTMHNNCTVAGIDTSDAVGRDYITMVIMDEQTLETYATFAVNETNIIRFSDWICKLASKYESMTLIPERKSSGVTLIDSLLIHMPLNGMDPFRRIYNTIVDESNKYKDEYREMMGNFNRRTDSYYDKMKKYFGYSTSGSGNHSRDNLYDVLQAAARLGGDKCYDKKLIKEINGLETRNNRIDHAVGGHDDTVVSWLLVVWLLSQSKNLGFYGINKPLRKAKEYKPGAKEKEVITVVDMYMEDMQERLRDQIEDVLELLRTEKNEVLIRRYEFRLRSMESQLESGIEGAFSLDELIKEATAQRQQSMRSKQKHYSPGGYAIGYF